MVAAFRDDQNMGDVTVQYRTNSTNRVVDGITYLNRDITITPSVQPTVTIPVKLYYLNAELSMAGIPIGAVGCSKTDNVCGDPPKVGTRLQSTSSTGYGMNGAVAQFNVSGFSTFYAASYLALPLELKSFTGQTLPASNLIRWETLAEKNIQYHIVERSANGSDWTEIGRKAGRPDAQNLLQYELEDLQPPAKAYYRLRSVDYDGMENLSNSIVLNRKSDRFGITAAFPSPARDRITVQFSCLSEEDVVIRLTDVTGRVVLEQEFSAMSGINEVNLSLNDLQPGIYLANVTGATQTSPPVRVTKE